MHGNWREIENVEGLWRRHYDDVHRYVLRRCGDDDIAQDLAAETFLHAAQASRRGTVITAGWLMVVASRRLADHWRSSYRATALSDRIAHDQHTRGHVVAEVTLEGSLEQALGRLCESQRSGLVLRYGQDRSVQEVADHLNLSYAATESLLSRGRRRLRQEYQSLS